MLIITSVFLVGILYYGITKPIEPKPVTERPTYNSFSDVQTNLDKILVKKVPIIYPNFALEKESILNYKVLGEILLSNLNQNYNQLMIPILENKRQEQEKLKQQAILLQQYLQEDLRIKEAEKRKVQQKSQEIAKQKQDQLSYERRLEDIKLVQESQRKSRMEQYRTNQLRYEEKVAQMKRDYAQETRESDDDEWRRISGGPIRR